MKVSAAKLCPKGARFGQLASFGNVAEQFLVTGDGAASGETYARSDMLPGTGYYPFEGRLAFVSLALEQGIATGRILGWLERGSAKSVPIGDRREAWAVVGKGAWPAFCDDEKLAKKVRCSKLEGRRDQKVSRDWIAGVWPTAEAADTDLKELGADPKKLEYFAMGFDADEVPKGPNGKKPLTVLKQEKSAARR